MPKKKASAGQTGKTTASSSQVRQTGRVILIDFELTEDVLRCCKDVVDLQDQGEAEELPKRLECLGGKTLLVYCCSEDQIAANLVRGLAEHFCLSFFYPEDERECLMLLLLSE